MPDKTIVIVFPPLTMPTSPPLGAAMLKGFIQRELPDWRVKVLDLNLWTFQRLFDSLAEGKLTLDPKQFSAGALAEIALGEAAQVFRGRRSEESFYSRPDRYELYGELFLRFTTVYNTMLHQACESHEQGGALSPIIQEMLDLILSEGPDCVGFSMIFSDQLPIGALLGKLLRREHGKKVLMGGSCFVDTAEHFMKWYPDAADIVVAGEGEDALKKLLADLDKPDEVPGAVFWKDGAIQKVPPVFREDLDFFGLPDFSDVNLHDYYSPQPVIPLLLSRGCYWRRCTFCVHYRSAGLSYRMHSMPFVINMLKHFTDQGIRNFAFIDEMIAPKHFEWLAKAIKEADLDIAYYALSKPTKYFTPDTMRMMKESGCQYMLWGLESGNQRVLNLMDKGTKVEDVAMVLRRAHEAGIRNHVFMICGFPTETVEEFEDTIRMLDENKEFIYATHRGTFVLERKSPIFESPERYGITRVWMKKDDASGGRWGYETGSGMTAEQAWQVFSSVLPFLRVFNPYARTLANFRDHALLMYGKVGDQLQPDRRQFPTVRYRAKAPQQISLEVIPEPKELQTTGAPKGDCCDSHGHAN